MHEIKILLFIIRSIRISFKKFNSSNFFKRKIDENNLIVSKKMFTDTKFRYRVNLSLSRLLQHMCVSRREKKKLAQASIDGASTEITLNLTRSLRVKKKKKKENGSSGTQQFNKYFSHSTNFYFSKIEFQEYRGEFRTGNNRDK